ncbi:MAG: metal-dependent hydrolase [Bacteroidetes bacterium RIFCSPLOWO2_02_FULL_36_8]|nr:MAG: metal-dependent hydrolase [Bacteroidetes bacterium RIFCSPLOWO2_02_FULL_36_8]OFY71624.1 MAG: metal-dependent hydrolase [Bacteroidetes bacterium RIFCSPLOWO2_12_FULL_37_12]
MKITYFGHSCFLVEMGENRLLFDPFIKPNPLASTVNFSAIEADYIILSHGHVDHVADVEEIAKRTEATIIANWEIANWFGNKGIVKAHAMNTGGKCGFEFGTLKMVTAIHSSSMPDGTYGGNPNGYVIESAEKTFYYSGDTALTFDMKLIADEFKIDFAFFPIGDNFTMGIEDACAAATFVKTDTIIGMHYNTFPPIEISEIEVMETARINNKKLILMNVGETIEL